MSQENQSQSQNGVYEWNINGDLLQQFKDAKHKQRFQSPEFETIDGTVWTIRFYPRGDCDRLPDHCSIFLNCVKLNGKQNMIGVNWTFTIVEMDWIAHTAEAFTPGGQATGYSKVFKTDRLHNVDVMNIKCVVEETMDLTDDNTYFEWKVSNNLMQEWENAKYKKQFVSPSFHVIGTGYFYIRIYPNGKNEEGTVYLELVYPSIELNKKEEINVCHYIEIEAFDHYQIRFNGTSVQKGGCIKLNSPFAWNDIRNKSAMTIGIKIWEKGAFPRNTARVMSNICSERIIKIQNQSSETIANLKTFEHQNTALKREITELRSKLNETEHLRRDNEIMKAKLDECAMKDIKTFDAPQETEIDKDIAEKQKEFELNLTIDEHRLNEWTLDTVKMKNALKTEQKAQENVNDSMTDLLNRYIDCKELCDEQQTRMENVITHCSKLNKMKKILKKECVQCDEKTDKMDKENHDLSAKYETLKAERIKIQTQWMDALKDMNKCIDDENETNALKSH
eukprot:773995_1